MESFDYYQSPPIISYMKYFKTLLFCLFTSFLIAQGNVEINLEKPYFDQLEKIDIPIEDKRLIYIGDGMANELFYYSLVPKDSIEGMLVLFPPTGQNVETVLNHNIQLAKLAYDHRILLIVPSINFNLCLDENAMTFLNTTFKEVLERYEVPKDKVVMGGFSLGGMNAIRYTELAYEDSTQTLIKPVGVYGVDPPLDLTRLYYSFERAIRINFAKPAVQEAEVYIGKYNREFGGSPEENPEIYIQHSMYSKSEENGGNAKYLVDVPVRIYSDPDIDWHLKYRQVDYYDINALDQTAMINQLQILGNEKAEYINALGKGYRLDGRRHPHSWSIAEPVDCINWILDCMK